MTLLQELVSLALTSTPLVLLALLVAPQSFVVVLQGLLILQIAVQLPTVLRLVPLVIKQAVWAVQLAWHLLEAAAIVDLLVLNAKHFQLVVPVVLWVLLVLLFPVQLAFPVHILSHQIAYHVLQLALHVQAQQLALLARHPMFSLVECALAPQQLASSLIALVSALLALLFSMPALNAKPAAAILFVSLAPTAIISKGDNAWHAAVVV